MEAILLTLVLAQVDNVIDQPIVATEVGHTTRLASTLGYQDEVLMPDRSRCDLLSDTHAIEVEWASKWKEAPGQATLYAIWTGKQPAIYLLVKNWQHDRVSILRCRLVCERLGIKLVFVKVKP